METDIELWELNAPAFTKAIPALLDVYVHAMKPPSDQLSGRRAIMERHAHLPRFHCVLAALPGGEATVGFAYGFHGQEGQWWHDVVTDELRLYDPAAVHQWFSDSFEVAEVHVHPQWQGQGVGRRMLERLTAQRRERTAVLSTPSNATPAHGLYHSYGFIEILTNFHFPGSPHQAFTVMAAWLPLRRERGRRRPADRSRGWRWTG
ncbi:GNAT family N-acetyltransferase [Salinactinospora qingdaonensis]|uniref:GNAT family N-acetyltransferase n=1 Tax=Salinactinospora qingdaonensis TaxID=702744 RepID=A0ABP7FCU5_9ACTN